MLRRINDYNTARDFLIKDVHMCNLQTKKQLDVTQLSISQIIEQQQSLIKSPYPITNVDTCKYNRPFNNI